MALLCSRWLAGDVEIVIDGESAGGGVGLIALSEGSAGEERGGEGNEERRGDSWEGSPRGRGCAFENLDAGWRLWTCGRICGWRKRSPVT